MFTGFAKSDQFNFLIVIGVSVISYPAFKLLTKKDKA